MSTPVRLTPASYAVLGVCALRGETTSYELKRYVGESIRYIWPIPHVQLYEEPQRLAALGLLDTRQESDGRRRRYFTVTGDGRAALAAWLAEDDEPEPDLRDVGLLKLHFGGLSNATDVRALAARQVALRRDRLANFLSLQERYDGRSGGHELMTLRLGQALERTVAAFWEEIADHADALADGRISRVDLALTPDPTPEDD